VEFRVLNREFSLVYKMNTSLDEIVFYAPNLKATWGYVRKEEKT